MNPLTPVRAMRSSVARWGSRLYQSLEVRDVLMLAGLSMLAAGTYLIYEPSALVVSGGLLFYLGVWHK